MFNSSFNLFVRFRLRQPCSAVIQYAHYPTYQCLQFQIRKERSLDLFIFISFSISVAAASRTCLLQVPDADDVRPVLQCFGKEGIGHAQDDRRPAGERRVEQNIASEKHTECIFTVSKVTLTHVWQRASEEGWGVC